MKDWTSVRKRPDCERKTSGLPGLQLRSYQLKYRLNTFFTALEWIAWVKLE